MKTITLDYETYEQELDAAFKRGQGSEAMEKAREIISKLARKDYSIKETDLYNWIREYGE